ncbi:TRAP transporter permease [Gelria sp. Kuro-4]|uniref:TRAP transporter permease n=1 Tax=Gelria sp. Kuro-4 TaxID=2796927 RepID=UPI001BEF9A0C|nr:TRAP transporter permease [Gelria sp. Kuro-4]BCV25903.1 C4-dicarboxylate ABC transporter [Gelria sp. Kuro-4]
MEEFKELTEKDIEEVRAKVDMESNYRRLAGTWARVIRCLAVAMSVYQLYTAVFGVLPAQLQRTWHLGFALALIFLLYPSNRKSRRAFVSMYWLDVVLALLGAGVNLYWIINYQDILMRAGDATKPDLVVGAIAVLLVLEAARRIVGLPITAIAALFVLYAYVGPYLPGFLSHRGFSVERIISHMFFTTEGILGIPLGVSSTFVFLFILFGAFLEKTGIGQFIIDLANAVAGRAVGGPAKVAVIASAMQGTISGSSVANVVGTGSFTIPLMKSIGYKANFAGAVEAAASTGGQIMPPIMGAAAFLMAEFTGIPYARVALAAVIPALLYFTGVGIGVHLEARRTGLTGLPEEQVPRLGKVLRERGLLLIPILGLIVIMASGATPTKAALLAMVLAILVSSISPKTRLKPKDVLDALEQGARGALGVAAATAAAGMIIGSVTLTGLGLKLANGLVTLAHGNLLLTMFFAMIASLILGMGSPTTANYVITSTIASPALIHLGVPLLAAHMFVFYFGIVADLTPPVALAAYAGAGIAKGEPMATGVNATKLAIGAFLVPYIFVMSPQLLLINTTVFGALRVAVGAVIGMLALEAAVQGWLLKQAGLPERAALALGGLMLIDPGSLTDIVGLTLFVVIYLLQRGSARRQGINYVL